MEFNALWVKIGVFCECIKPLSDSNFVFGFRKIDTLLYSVKKIKGASLPESGLMY